MALSFACFEEASYQKPRLCFTLSFACFEVAPGKYSIRVSLSFACFEVQIQETITNNLLALSFACFEVGYGAGFLGLANS